MQRVTHKDIERACAEYNRALKLTFRGAPRAGYLRWADIRGDGRNKRGLYINLTDGHASGVIGSDMRAAGDTMRDTVAMIRAVIACHKRTSGLIIHRCIHFRGIEQRAALRELHRRGLWLPPEQIEQGALVRTASGYPRQP